MQKLISITLVAAALSACQTAPATYTTEQAKILCTDEMREAQGPRTGVTLGANSRTGMSMGFEIEVNDKFLRGISPQQAYNDCMKSLTIVDR